MCTNRHRVCDPGFKCHRLISILSLSYFKLKWFAASSIIIIIIFSLIIDIVWFWSVMIIDTKIVYSDQWSVIIVLLSSTLIIQLNITLLLFTKMNNEHASYPWVVFVSVFVSVFVFVKSISTSFSSSKRTCFLFPGFLFLCLILLLSVSSD